MTRRQWLADAGIAGLVARVPGAAAPDQVVTSCRVYTAAVDPRAWVAVQLGTSGGLTGIGDATSGEREPRMATAAVRAMFEVVRGRTPFAIERLREAAQREVAAAGPERRRRTAAGCSAVEQCLWDLQGKLLGLPCHELFGGRLRDTVHTYANINRATRGADRTASGFAKQARLGVEAGFDAFKLAPFDHLARNTADSPERLAAVRQGIGFVDAVRREIGSERELLIDGHSRFDAPQAIEVGRQLEPYGLYWMEEMCRSHQDLARFNSSTDVQTAGGEMLWGVGEFSTYIHSGAVDTVMPDVKYCGGMYELKKIAAMAEGAGLHTSPHGPASPVGNMAAAHVCLTLPNFTILELAFGEVPWRARAVQPAEDVRDGYLRVRSRPGLGYELNPEFWSQYAA